MVEDEKYIRHQLCNSATVTLRETAYGNLWFTPLSRTIIYRRGLQKGGFGYWEAGMDMHMGDNLFESFVNYQTRILTEFEKMSVPYKFQVIDAAQPADVIAEQLKERIRPLLP